MVLTFTIFYFDPITWARDNSGIVSVIGALIIFFSWVVTNTLAQRYSRLKTSVESAQSTFRLYTKLNELRNSLNSLAMEVVQNKTSIDASSFMPGRMGNPDIDRAQTDFALTRLSAHQIKELMDFTVETHSFSKSVGNTTEASRQVEALLKEIDQLHSRVRDQEREVEKCWQPASQSFDNFQAAAHKYIAFVRNEAIPRVPSLYEKIVNASNLRHKEGRERLAKSKSRADRSSKAALALYLLGSILALSGQYLDKTKPKAPETPVVQQNP